MTTGYIYVLHGRRGGVPDDNIALLTDFITRKGQNGRIAFLEGDVQTLEDAIVQTQEQVSHIVIVPVLLYSATHMRWDIPRRTEKVLNPSVTVEVTKTLAETQAVQRYLVNLLQTAVKQHPTRSVLLVAHGTPHFPEPFEHLSGLAATLQETVGVPVIATNHIGHPTIEETLADDRGPLIVERLFLTDGRLAGKIKARVEAAAPDSVFLPTMEDDPVITRAIEERLAEL